MKNFKIFAIAALAAFGLASCNERLDDNTPKGLTQGEAYLAIDVQMTSPTRGGSSEGDVIDGESDLKTLYLITFDADSKVLGIPGGSAKYVQLNASAIGTAVPAEPEAQKVSAAAKKLLVIANPGTKLLAVLNAMTVGQTWTTINAAIANATIGELKDATKGFAMITAGDATGKTGVAVGTEATATNKIDNPFVNIDGKVVEITSSESEAKAAAEAARVDVALERLASKLNVSVAAGTALNVKLNATFEFDKWAVDVVNTTFFPFAVKTLTDGTHTAGKYATHFYTQDPNYEDVTTGTKYHADLKYGFADATNNYEPSLAQGDWMNASTTTTPQLAYVIENTMAASAQRFGNATRLVIRAFYTPEDFTAKTDWFSFAGVNYKTFAELQTAYGEAGAPADLKAACDAFYTQLKVVKPAITATNFAALAAADLTGVANGGDVMKNTNEGKPIRWYQGGRNYYYYEIRHDNQRDGQMAFSKYGVVRNNSYKLTLNEVNGPGTPWYPDVKNPGDGDPKPEDPIDQATGFLGVKVEVNPWIVWETGFGI